MIARLVRRCRDAGQAFADRRRVDRVLERMPADYAAQPCDTLIPAIRNAMARLDAEADARERWASMDGDFYDGRL